MGQFAHDVVPEEATQKIDPNIVKTLPQRPLVVSIETLQSTPWARTARVYAEEDVSYFLKVTKGQQKRDMVRGEFEAMSIIHASASSLAPKPIAWGEYSTVPELYFFLCEFIDLDKRLPDPHALTSSLIALHETATSPQGKFGFGHATYHGGIRIDHGWHDTWEGHFSSTTRALLQREQRVWRWTPEQMEMESTFFEEVVPKLLKPLETSKEGIRPSFIHGDMWHDNTAVDRKTGNVVIFDSAGFYAHHEYEMAVWRQSWNNIGRDYIDAYLAQRPPSEPQEDLEDRALLYGLRVNILDAILYDEEEKYHLNVIDSMMKLVSKFVHNE
ncbi:Fructosamine kinase-domain-containing protein [Emericellopsis atlantica]|uniref:protein-ribulosamine 3-kinase n=1 Tax=Emericellopsis atlantica TaxID=2614577 RepID=A0A9P7ZIS5_9HYPO|nr:Fructosamine kinase-domain-containing protein [Emericellopsis atlantica]KAG9252547.1 Fructosamine kinase-domain-containing protein [Emericellopsis atlantica]